MSDRDKVVELYGEHAAIYLDRKHRGGMNNYNGGKYEEFFAVHQVALLCPRLFENAINANIEAQSYSFVDDLVVTDAGDVDFLGHQLKNAKAISWNSGANPIAQDFAWQYGLCKEKGYQKITLVLVLSNKELQEELAANIPNDIKEFAQTKFFPFFEAPAQLLADHASIVRDFRYLANKEDCGDTECLNIATTLMGVMSANAGKLSVSEVLALARKCSPQIIRPICTEGEAEATLRNSFKQILDNIQGFQYSVKRGFLTWKYSVGTTVTSGTLSFDCFDPRFGKIQDLIEAKQPQNFDDLEGLLL